MLPIEEAIRKMTGLAAQNTGISDRGVIRPGAAADLVLFNPDTIIDRATPKDPQAVSVGVDRVWVNGRVVFTNGHATEDRPGVVITRENGGNPSAG